MIHYDLVLEKSKILDEKGRLYKNYSLGITDGKIAYIGKKKLKASEYIDCSNKIISPTFANAHAHGPMNILKGIAEDVNIDDWFNLRIFPYESSLEPEDIYLGTKLAIYEMINNGITCYAEHYFMEQEILKAVEETGIRIDLSPTILSLDNVEKRIEYTLDLKRKYNNNENIDISFGPHSPYMCNEIDLKRIAETASEFNMKIHIHVGETKKQFTDHFKKYGETPLETLKKTGILKRNTILAHSLYFSETDLALLNNQTIVLSPKTYMKLSMDMSRIFSNYQKLNLTLGTDGGASSNTLNIVEQGEILALLGKYELNNSKLFSLKEIWGIMMNTHNIFKFNTGKLKLQSPADLIIWDFSNNINTVINHDILANIIYTSNNENIDGVMISGKFVKQNGKIKGFDQEFLQKINKRMDRLLIVGAGTTQLKF